MCWLWFQSTHCYATPRSMGCWPCTQFWPEKCKHIARLSTLPCSCHLSLWLTGHREAFGRHTSQHLAGPGNRCALNGQPMHGTLSPSQDSPAQEPRGGPSHQYPKLLANKISTSCPQEFKLSGPRSWFQKEECFHQGTVHCYYPVGVRRIKSDMHNLCTPCPMTTGNEDV